MTNDELDALVRTLRDTVTVNGLRVKAADAIAALRADLAAKDETVQTLTNMISQPTEVPRLHLEVIEATARAERAEADAAALRAALAESCDERRTFLLHELGCPCPAEVERDTLRHERNVLQKICAERSDETDALRALLRRWYDTYGHAKRTFPTLYLDTDRALSEERR